MKILIIPSWLSLKPNGFSGSFILEQARALYEHKVDVSICYLQRLGFGISTQPEIADEEYHGIPVTVGQNKALPKLNQFLIDQWYKQYEFLFEYHIERFGQPDCIHAHGYIAGFTARRLSENFDIPFVLTEHNSNLLTNQTRPWHRNEITKTYKNARALIAVSDILKTAMETFTKNPIHVIPNLVDNDIFQIATDQRPNEKFRFLVVGGLVPLKRVDRVIEAFAEALKSKPVELHIVGNGPEEKRLKEFSQSLKITEHIRFLGVCSPEQVAQEMRQTDVLITASKVETFGKVIIEALSSGTPVLCAHSADPNRIVDKLHGLRIESDLSGLVAGMIQMIERSAEFDPNEMRKSIISRYGKDVVVKALLNLYRQIVK